MIIELKKDVDNPEGDMCSDTVFFSDYIIEIQNDVPVTDVCKSGLTGDEESVDPSLHCNAVWVQFPLLQNERGDV